MKDSERLGQGNDPDFVVEVGGHLCALPSFRIFQKLERILLSLCGCEHVPCFLQVWVSRTLAEALDPISEPLRLGSEVVKPL